MRFQLEDKDGGQYCAKIVATPSGTIPWGLFAKECYNATPGATYSPTTPIVSAEIVVPSEAVTARAFCFCVLSLGPA